MHNVMNKWNCDECKESFYNDKNSKTPAVCPFCSNNNLVQIENFKYHPLENDKNLYQTWINLNSIFKNES